MSLKEDQKIGEAIENYLKGIKTGEEKLFEKAFQPDSVVINGNENDPQKSTVSISDFVKNIKISEKDRSFKRCRFIRIKQRHL